MSRLKELRNKKGISQVQVQMKTGIDQSDYSKMETGKRLPTLEQARALSYLFDTSVDYLCGMTDDPKPPTRPSELPIDIKTQTESSNQKQKKK